MQVVYVPPGTNPRHREPGTGLVCEECGTGRVIAKTTNYPGWKYLRSLRPWPFDRKQRAAINAYRKEHRL